MLSPSMPLAVWTIPSVPLFIMLVTFLPLALWFLTFQSYYVHSNYAPFLLYSFPIMPPSHYAPCYIIPFLYALFSLYHIYFLPFPLIPYLFNYFYSSFIHLVLFTLIMFLSHWAPRATQGSFIISRYVILNDYFTSHKLNIQKCSFIWLFCKNDRILYHFVLRKIIIIWLFSSMLPPNPFLLS